MPEYQGTEYDFYPGAPKFFRRVYNTMGTPPVRHEADAVIITQPFDDLIIYGFSAKSPYLEDTGEEARLFRAGRFMSFCFSEVVPEGEYGSTPLDAVEEITEQEFNEAKERGWV